MVAGQESGMVCGIEAPHMPVTSTLLDQVFGQVHDRGDEVS